PLSEEEAALFEKRQPTTGRHPLLEPGTPRQTRDDSLGAPEGVARAALAPDGTTHMDTFVPADERVLFSRQMRDPDGLFAGRVDQSLNLADNHITNRVIRSDGSAIVDDWPAPSGTQFPMWIDDLHPQLRPLAERIADPALRRRLRPEDFVIVN
ncbi:MAG: hypothetical protein AAGB03_02560, partial [Pseudomonadota bacterium]